MGEVVKAVSDQSPDNSVLVTDVGQNQMFSARYFKFRSKRSIVTSGGLGTMGFCLPAAIGATFGTPERMVFAFQGDGGFQMNIQELGTVMQTGAPVKMIVLNNTYLGNVRQWQQMMFNCRYSCTHMMNPDYNKVAAGYGIPYKRVEKREELKDSIAEMINFKGAFILEVIVMDEENVMPMIPPGNSVDNMIFSLADN
ncbi:MAG: Acetolactate synthase isozyme 2 large subunit [Bacteroidetes bacterium ADurb.BinA104]|nr:MAG: Acetolactate synthase isozyme 2 large subunit [Bacteroidetes bacterium ADurb.BinA104]